MAREIIVDVEAHSLEKMKKQAVARLVQPEGDTFRLYCDEGPDIGGDNTAPPPLSIFTSAVAFCLLTQVTRYAAMLKVQVKDAKVNVRSVFNVEGSALKGTIKGTCQGFHIDLFIESDDSEEAVTKLIQTAHNACFLESTLVNPVNMEFKNYVNGEEV